MTKRTRRVPDQKLMQALKKLSDNNPRAKTLLPVYGEFRDSVDALFDSCKKYLHGDYNLYTVYKDLEKDPIVNYGLVHADYYEKDCGGEEEFLNTYKNDAILLQKKLLESKLPLDYYFIMPYYTRLNGNSALYNGNSALYNGNIILTNELKPE